jgi:hypothetical protein
VDRKLRSFRLSAPAEHFEDDEQPHLVATFQVPIDMALLDGNYAIKVLLLSFPDPP